jgi:hypothetical protein
MIEILPGSEPQYLLDVNTLTAALPIPASFDPLALPPSVRPTLLAALDLPAEPDPATQPALHAFWTELFSPPLTFVSGHLISPQPSTLPKVVFSRAPVRTRQQSSSNWSGASLVARDGRMFTDVMAKWRVPNIAVPASASATDEHKCSCWVGLDGQRFYPNATLPQIGTEQVINEGNVSAPAACNAWFQWWPMGVMLIPQNILPLAFGDLVYGWLTATSYRCVRAVIKVVNPALTTGYLMRIRAHVPPTAFTFPPNVAYDAKIAGATAEWVTEAPTGITTRQILPLPDYGRVCFESCFALSALEPQSPYRSEPLIGPSIMSIFSVQDSRRQTLSKGDRPNSAPGLNTVTTAYVPRTP